MSEQSPKKRSGTPGGLHDAMKKATTEMLVLFVLCQKPMYTYEMMQAIEKLSHGKITFNTLYQAIYRLKDHNHIQEWQKEVSADNRLRIYFSITDAGRSYLQQLIAEYVSFTAAVDEILSQDPTFRTLGKEMSNPSCAQI